MGIGLEKRKYMNRRSFVKSVSRFLGGLCTLPITRLFYDPLTQKTIPPPTLANIPNDMLHGYKGNQFLECGYIYAPYIPLMMTEKEYETYYHRA